MRTIILTTLLIVTAVLTGRAQLSDFTVKKNFEDRYRTIATRIDSASTTEQLEALTKEIAGLGSDFAPHQAFLDKALYPSTFAESMAKLRSLQVLTYDRVYLIQTQGVKLSEMESRLASISSRLDSLTAQRDQLFGELQESKKSIASLREAVKRLAANLQAKDRLIFSLADSIFLPYGKDVHQVADVQKEAIGQKLEKANVVTRVYEIAADNVKFLEVTQLQGKDYGNLIDQYQTFKNRWAGLKDQMAAVVSTSAPVPAPGTGKAGGTPAASKVAAKPATTDAATQAAHVDSVVSDWHARLNATFWGALQKELAASGAGVAPFTDGPTFSASIRTYVATLQANNQDPTPFTETIWKGRIDKEWRDALSKESMLGKAEYASLDKLVSELSKESVDLRLILYILVIVVIALAVWYFVFRRKKEPAAQQ